MNFNDGQEIVCRRGTMGEMGGQGMVAERIFFFKYFIFKLQCSNCLCVHACVRACV